jgi:hypothetical protein
LSDDGQVRITRLASILERQTDLIDKLQPYRRYPAGEADDEED